MLLSLLAVSALKVASVRLEELALSADRIVVARVDDIAAFPRRPRSPSWAHPSTSSSQGSFDVARARIIRSIKGAPDAGEVFFLASCTWPCDLGTAVEGETVLLFLVHAQGVFRRESAAEPERIDAYTSRREVYAIAWHGRGRMPIDDDDNGRPIASWSTDVATPLSLRTTEHPSQTSLTRAPLDELEACMQIYVAVGEAPLVYAFDRGSKPPARDWDLRISADGRACVRYSGDGPSEDWVGRLDESTLTRLRAKLSVAGARTLPDIAGEIARGAEERILSLFAEPKSEGGERVATTTRLIGPRDTRPPDAGTERAWSLWNDVERLTEALVASWGRTTAPK
ncbi:MAG: hypothetical protein ACKVWV_07635 [Planctomycetota bacterium]